MFHSFHNTPPYPEETLIIDRLAENGIAMEAYLPIKGLKHELLRVYKEGIMLRRQYIEMEANKSF